MTGSKIQTDFKITLASMPRLDPSWPSLGLASINGFLRSRDISVKIYGFHRHRLAKAITNILYKARYDSLLFHNILADRTAIRDKEVRFYLKTLDLFVQYTFDRILASGPDLLGLSVFESNALPSLLLAKKIKDRHPGIKIVLGGPECHLARNGSYFISLDFVDAVVLGEGEQALYKLIRMYRTGVFKLCPGAMVKVDKSVVDGSKQGELLDMNQLPFPLFSDEENQNKEIPLLPIAFNRGCVANCTFCGEKNIWKTYRQMTPDRAVAMVEKMQELYHAKRVRLNQSLLNGDIRWLDEFCDRMIQKQVPVHWEGNARIHPAMDQGLLEKMYRAGCRYLFFGVESASDKVLRDMKKGITVSLASRVIQDTFKAKIKVHTYWILGYPTEEETDLINTLAFIIRYFWWIDSMQFHIFSLSTSSDLFDAYAGPAEAEDRGKPGVLSSIFRNYRSQKVRLREKRKFRSPNFRKHSKMIRFFVALIDGINRQHPLESADKRALLLSLKFFKKSVENRDLALRWQTEPLSKTTVIQTIFDIIEGKLLCNPESWITKELMDIQHSS